MDRLTCQTVSSVSFDQEQRQKYINRGWRSIRDGIALLRPEFQRDRRVGDKYTWVLPLRFEEPPPSPKDPRTDILFAHGWRINTHPEPSCLFEWRFLFHARLPTTIAYSGGWFGRRVIDKYLKEGQLRGLIWCVCHSPMPILSDSYSQE